MKNRKREICTSGTVRDEDGNILIYSANRSSIGIIRLPFREKCEHAGPKTKVLKCGCARWRTSERDRGFANRRPNILGFCVLQK
jgi:hypothetical protein